MGVSEDGGVVVITGANEGIGYHLATALLDGGARIAGLDIEIGQLQSLQEHYPDRLIARRCDVAADADVRRAVNAVLDAWDRIDVLVNNAAIFEFGRFETQSEVDARREFEVNYFGARRTIGAVLPHMKAQGSGIIHNVSSGVGLVGHPGLSGYAATKGAIEALTRTLRLELHGTGVACTVMHPPLTATRSAVRLGYPSFMLSDSADVGRKLAAKIDSTGPVVAADLQTRVGLAVAQRVPRLVRWGTERVVDLDGE